MTLRRESRPWIVLMAALGAAIIALFVLRKIPDVMESPSRDLDGAGGVSVTPEVDAAPNLERLREDRFYVHWRVVDEYGAPLSSASAEIEGHREVCNADGRGTSAVLRVPVPVCVSCDGYREWRGQLSEQGIQEIVLLRVAPVTVAVIDDAGKPLADAEVILDRRWTEPLRVGARSSLQGTTNKDGVYRVGDVEHGLYVVTCRKQGYILSEDAQEQAPEAVSGAGSATSSELVGSATMPLGNHPFVLQVPSQEKRIVLAAPWVIVLRVEDAIPILDCHLRASNPMFRPPTNEEGWLGREGVRKDLERRFPGSRAYVYVKKQPIGDAAKPVRIAANGLPVGSFYEAEVHVAGRMPWRGTVTPVPLADLTGPINIPVASMPVSRAFGSVQVHVKSRSYSALDEHARSRLGAEWWIADARGGPRKWRTFAIDDLQTLPAGRYQLRFRDAYWDSLAKAKDAIEVAEGTHVDVLLEPREDFREIHVRGDIASAGSVVIECAESGFRLTRLVDNLRAGFRGFVPHGRVVATLGGRSLQTGALLSGCQEFTLDERSLSEFMVPVTAPYK
ncbi:MAG: Carboxypeptidase regulatory-like domain [Planctomycetota bacterium]|jgi:hypothetical protein